MKQVVLLLIFIIPLSLSAKEGKDHVKDMQKVMPFSEKDGRVNRFYKLLTSTIDLDKNGKQQLKPDFLFSDPKFNKLIWGSPAEGGHRWFYHWGFNTDPIQNDNLRVNCIDYYVQNHIISYNDADELKEKIRQDWQSQKNMLLREAAKVFGFPASSKQLNALVSIIYDIHILGDYTTPKTYMLIDKRELFKDMYSSIWILTSAGGNKDKKSYNELVSFLRRYEENTKVYLEKLADNKHGLGQYLLKRKIGTITYETKFEKKGIKLKEY